jgi:hypothetical protein
MDRWEQLIVRTASRKQICELSQHADVDERLVHRLNLRSIARRKELFDAEAGPPLFTLALPPRTSKAGEIETLRQQRNSAWEKLQHVTRQRDAAWQRLEKIRSEVATGSEFTAAINAQKCLITKYLRKA